MWNYYIGISSIAKWHKPSLNHSQAHSLYCQNVLLTWVKSIFKSICVFRIKAMPGCTGTLELSVCLQGIHYLMADLKVLKCVMLISNCTIQKAYSSYLTFSNMKLMYNIWHRTAEILLLCHCITTNVKIIHFVACVSHSDERITGVNDIPKCRNRT